MIAPAILPVQPNDSAPDLSQPESPVPSQGPVPDFGALLFLFSAQPDPQAPGAAEGADPSGADDVPPTDDSKPAKLSLQLVLTPALISLYDQAKQVVASQPGSSGEFSEALDLSPIFSPEPALTQALPFGGRLPEEIPAAPVNLDTGETTDKVPSFPSLFPHSSTPEQTTKTESSPSQLALVTQEVEQTLSLPSLSPVTGQPMTGVSPETGTDKVQKGKDEADKLVFSREPVKPQRGAQIFNESSEVIAPDPAPSRADNPAEKNLGQEKKSESEGQGWQASSPASSRAGIDVPRDPENFVPPGLAVADARVAARVEGSPSLPSERSGFFDAKNEVPARPADKIEPNPQAQAMVHEKFFHGVERERAVEPPPANAFSSVIERVAAEISTHTRQGQQEVTMRLEPPELGSLKIELVLDGDRLQARVTAEVADTRNLIQTHLPELREALQAHKLDLVNVQVDLGGWGGPNGGLAQDSRHDSGGRGDLVALPSIVQATEGETKEPTKTASPPTGAVSVWA
jgi:hypothetical protein